MPEGLTPAGLTGDRKTDPCSAADASDSLTRQGGSYGMVKHSMALFGGEVVLLVRHLLDGAAANAPAVAPALQPA